MSTLPSGTVTFLFTDIEGSTKLAQQYPSQWESLRGRHHAILQSAVDAQNGYVFQIIGDAFCVAFSSASEALNAALEAQQCLFAEDWSPAPIKVRMGIHTGAAQLKEDGQYVGYASLATTQRIMSAGYGGQVLLSSSTRELVRDMLPPDVSLLDLGEKRLKDLQLPKSLYQLNISGLSATFPPLKTLDSFPNNLPMQITTFIGRKQEITEVRQILESHRLVTLTGPGGTGKTRLSLQVAQETLDQFPNGVYFVPLADDTDANQLISRVAQQLEVREGGRPLLENVKDYLHDKRMLLVLDNFEQLVSAAPVVTELLAAAPQLKIISSSRIALNLHGERRYLVPPLELPQAENESTLENLIENESINLFVGRAQAVHPNFALKKDNATAVAEICRRLDGLPLALELAAARVKLLQPQAILRRLDDKLKLLTGGARDLPSRQQTLRNTLEWSYSLLNEGEKQLYARLSVFVGGFTLEAAETVCNAENKFDILEGLTALVDNSLLRQEEPPDGETRFSMLEIIRAYAVERLAESGETPALQANHAQYFGNIIFNQAGLEIYTSNSQRWLTWFERELDNIRATLNWSLATPQGIQIGLGFIFLLFWFWYRRGYFTEGQQWAEKFLAVPDIQNVPPRRALALASSGMMALWQGQQDTALGKLQETLAIEQQLEDDRMVAISQMANGIAFINMGRDGDAQPLLQQAGQFFKQASIDYFHGLTLVHLGNAELGLGHTEQARAYHEEALGKAREINENWLIAFALNNLGEVARTQRQFEIARKYYEECETLLPDSGDKGDRARFVHSLGYIAQHEGHYERAESQFRSSLTMFRRLGNRRGMAECMAGLAGLKARQGKAEWGAVVLSAAETILKVTGGAWWPADRAEVEANQEFLRSALGEVELSAAQKKGRAMTLEQALAFVSET